MPEPLRFVQDPEHQLRQILAEHAKRPSLVNVLAEADRQQRYQQQTHQPRSISDLVADPQEINRGLRQANDRERPPVEESPFDTDTQELAADYLSGAPADQDLYGPQDVPGTLYDWLGKGEYPWTNPLMEHDEGGSRWSRDEPPTIPREPMEVPEDELSTMPMDLGGLYQPTPPEPMTSPPAPPRPTAAGLPGLTSEQEMTRGQVIPPEPGISPLDLGEAPSYEVADETAEQRKQRMLEALMMAGLGMMQGRGNFLENVGRGGALGLERWFEADRERKADEERRIKGERESFETGTVAKVAEQRDKRAEQKMRLDRDIAEQANKVDEIQAKLMTAKTAAEINRLNALRDKVMVEARKLMKELEGFAQDEMNDMLKASEAFLPQELAALRAEMPGADPMAIEQEARRRAEKRAASFVASAGGRYEGVYGSGLLPME